MYKNGRTRSRFFLVCRVGEYSTLDAFSHRWEKCQKSRNTKTAYIWKKKHSRGKLQNVGGLMQSEVNNLKSDNPGDFWPLEKIDQKPKWTISKPKWIIPKLWKKIENAKSVDRCSQQPIRRVHRNWYEVQFITEHYSGLHLRLRYITVTIHFNASELIWGSVYYWTLQWTAYEITVIYWMLQNW